LRGSSRLTEKQRALRQLMDAMANWSTCVDHQAPGGSCCAVAFNQTVSRIRFPGNAYQPCLRLQTDVDDASIWNDVGAVFAAVRP